MVNFGRNIFFIRGFPDGPKLLQGVPGNNLAVFIKNGYTFSIFYIHYFRPENNEIKVDLCFHAITDPAILNEMSRPNVK